MPSGEQELLAGFGPFGRPRTGVRLREVVIEGGPEWVFEHPAPPSHPGFTTVTIYLTRAVQFSAAHRYHRPDWSEERNAVVFGPCANPHGHGHNYSVEITVAGTPDPDTGFCVDLPSLDRILREEVVDRLDHQHLNHAVPEFGPGGQIPTTENIAIWIWKRIEPRIVGSRLVRVRLREDATLFADYCGPASDTQEGILSDL